MARQGLSGPRVVEVASELADEWGFAHVTPTAVAQRCGVRTASLYAHVSGAGELRTAVALLALDELADAVADAVAGRSGREALGAFADAYRDYATRHPGRAEAARTRLDPEVAATGGGVRVARSTRAALRAYGLGEPDETHAVRLVGSLLHGFVALASGGGFDHSEPGPDATWQRIVDALDTTFTTWGSA